MVDLRSRRQNIEADSTDVLPDDRITPPANDLMMRLREHFAVTLPWAGVLDANPCELIALEVARQRGQQDVINFLTTLQTENKQ